MSEEEAGRTMHKAEQSLANRQTGLEEARKKSHQLKEEEVRVHASRLISAELGGRE